MVQERCKFEFVGKKRIKFFYGVRSLIGTPHEWLIKTNKKRGRLYYISRLVKLGLIDESFL